MPSFRDLPETLRPTARPERDEPPHTQPDHLPADQAVVDCGVYVDGQRLPGTLTHADAWAKVGELQLAGREAYAWIGLHEPSEHQMREVAGVFGLHPLAAEDAVAAHQRPKLERYDESLFLVLKTVNYVPHESIVLAREVVESGEIMIFVGASFVITVRHGEHSGLSDVRKRMEADPEQMRLGPYAVMHAIADYVVDSYLDVTHLMEADIDAVEEAWDVLAAVTDIDRVVPVTYMNSSAALKAFVGRHGGVVCTSSNARAVLTWALGDGAGQGGQGDQVLFFPDQHLGRNTGFDLGYGPDDMAVWNPRLDRGGLDREVTVLRCGTTRRDTSPGGCGRPGTLH